MGMSQNTLACTGGQVDVASSDRQTMLIAAWQERECSCVEQGPTSSPKRRPTPKEMPKPYTRCSQQQRGQVGTGRDCCFRARQLRSTDSSMWLAMTQAEGPAVAKKQATDCARLRWQYCNLLNGACGLLEVLSDLCFCQGGGLIYLVHQLPAKALWLWLWLIHAQSCLEPLPSARHDAEWKGSVPEVASVFSSYSIK